MNVTLTFDDATVQRLQEQFPGVNLSDLACQCLSRVASNTSNVGELQAELRHAGAIAAALTDVDKQLPIKAPARTPGFGGGRGGGTSG